MLVTWLLTSVALFISICALFVALRTSARYRLQRPSVLSERFSQLDEQLELVTGALKTLKARVSMQDLRAQRRLQPPDPTAHPFATDPAPDDKAEIRRKLSSIAKPGG